MSSTLSLRVEFALICIGALAVSFAIVYYTGPVWTWDRAHYHVYAPFQWLDHLLGRGFFPGGPQAYLNPLAYVPALLLERAGVSALAIALFTAAFQITAAVGIWAIARLRSEHAVGPVLAMLLALFTSVFVSQLGTSYIDATTAVFIILGVLACRARPPNEASAPAWVVAGGFAMGVAVGLKLSHAIAIAFAPILFVPTVVGFHGLWPGLRRWIRLSLGFMLGVALGALLSYGQWGLNLCRFTGNPVYPYASAWFPSEPKESAARERTTDISPSPSVVQSGEKRPSRLESILAHTRISGARFVPESLADALKLPFRMADPRDRLPRAYVEWFAPEPKPLVLLLIGAVTVPVIIWRRRRSVSSGDSQAPQLPVAVDLRLVAYVGGSLVCWIISSANGRYAIPVLMLLAVPIVQCVYWLVGVGRVSVYSLLALVCFQCFCALVAQESVGWPTDRTWRSPGVQAEFPDRLLDEPTLHLASLFSWSYLLPKLHTDSSIATIPATCEGRCRDEVRQVLSQWAGRLRIFMMATRLEAGEPVVDAGRISVEDSWLSRFDLRVDATDCLGFRVKPVLLYAQIYQESDTTKSLSESDWVMSCRVIEDMNAAAALRKSAQTMDKLYALVESRCPLTLGPPAGPSDWIPGAGWIRRYPARDIDLIVRNGELYSKRTFFGQWRLGTVEEIESMDLLLECKNVSRPLNPDNPAVRTQL